MPLLGPLILDLGTHTGKVMRRHMGRGQRCDDGNRDWSDVATG